MAWSNYDFKNIYPSIRSIVNSKYSQLDDMEKNCLIQDAAVMAWKEQYKEKPTRWYLVKCVNSVAYDKRLCCVEKQDAKLKNPRPQFVSFEQMMSKSKQPHFTNPENADMDFMDFNPIDTSTENLFSDTYWIFDALREKGSQMMRHVLKQAFEGESLVSIAKEFNITLQTLKYHLRTEAKTIISGHNVVMKHSALSVTKRADYACATSWSKLAFELDIQGGY